ncbi:RNA-directed DNA polymerase [Flavobacterium gawalongense]|nr:RNA-directed DNA polymerase [Flavobacterium gawalongense]TRX29490.1 RNA-directed DNA polymerase [Flavobacterium gawalongense]
MLKIKKRHMLNQSFSFENFKIIHEIENRKGNYYKDFYSDEYHLASTLLKAKRRDFKAEKNKAIRDEAAYTLAFEQKEALEDLKENHLENDLNKFSNEVNRSDFNFKLTPFIPEPGSKTIYTTSKDAVSFFAMKQLQYNIFRTFKVKQANRYQIVKQVKILLQDKFPKFIIRTDIKSFYENVPQYELLKLIENNSLLSPKSVSLIKNLLYNYNILTNQLGVKEKLRKGIPRGIGVSPFLAELYMRKIDEEIKNIESVTFYGRYVDDIIIFFTPKSKYSSDNYLNKVKKIIEDKGLNINDDIIPGKYPKTQEVDLLNNNTTTKDISLLGYKFKIANSEFKDVELSENKKRKYKERITKSIDKYLNEYPHNSIEARKLLIHRFNYLTKNSKLHQPKKGLIGVYYSNSLLENDCVSLNRLDQMLHTVVDTKLPIMEFSNLNKRLKKFSFLKGFNEKSFYNINGKKKNIPDLRSAKYKTAKILTNNFERIVEAWK